MYATYYIATFVLLIICMSSIGYDPSADEDTSGEDDQCASDHEILSHLLTSAENRSSLLIAPTFPLLVRITFGTHAIIAMQPKEANLALDAYLTLSWSDARLRFVDARPCAPTMKLSLEQKRLIWTPELNFHAVQEAFVLRLPHENTFVWIGANGTVEMQQKYRFRIPCRLNLDKFPMDLAICQITISSYTYDDTKVIVVWNNESPSGAISTLLNRNTEEHFLESTRAFQTVQNHLGIRFTQLTGHFYFRRRYSWYVLQAYIPSSLVIFISWLHVTLRPQNALPRLQIAAAMLLAVIVLFFQILQNVPRVGYIKALDVWLIACITFLITCTAETTLVALFMRFHLDAVEEKDSHRSEHQKVHIHTKVTHRRYASSPSLLVNGYRRRSSADVPRLLVQKNGPDENSGWSPLLALHNGGEKNAGQLANGAPPLPEENGNFFVTADNGGSRHPNLKKVATWATLARTLDNVFIVLLPIAFAAFNVVYWWFYLFRVEKLKQ